MSQALQAPSSLDVQARMRASSPSPSPSPSSGAPLSPLDKKVDAAAGSRLGVNASMNVFSDAPAATPAALTIPVRASSFRPIDPYDHPIDESDAEVESASLFPAPARSAQPHRPASAPGQSSFRALGSRRAPGQSSHSPSASGSRSGSAQGSRSGTPESGRSSPEDVELRAAPAGAGLGRPLANLDVNYNNQLQGGHTSSVRVKHQARLNDCMNNLFELLYTNNCIPPEVLAGNVIRREVHASSGICTISYTNPGDQTVNTCDINLLNLEAHANPAPLGVLGAAPLLRGDLLVQEGLKRLNALRDVMDKSFVVRRANIETGSLANKDGASIFQHSPDRAESLSKLKPSLKNRIFGGGRYKELEARVAACYSSDAEKTAAKKALKERINAYRVLHWQMKGRAHNKKVELQEACQLASQQDLRDPVNKQAHDKSFKELNVIKEYINELDSVQDHLMIHALAFYPVTDPVAGGDQSLDKRKVSALNAYNGILEGMRNEWTINPSAIKPKSEGKVLQTGAHFTQDERESATNLFTFFFNANDPATEASERKAMNELFNQKGATVPKGSPVAMALFQAVIEMQEGARYNNDLLKTALPEESRDLFSDAKLERAQDKARARMREVEIIKPAPDLIYPNKPVSV